MSDQNIKKNVQVAADVAVQISQNRKDALEAVQNTKQEAISDQKLWKANNKFKLIQVGMALIAVPEPTPTTVVIGAGFVAAGTAQRAIKNKSLYMEDIPKALKSTLKEINSLRF